MRPAPIPIPGLAPSLLHTSFGSDFGLGRHLSENAKIAKHGGFVFSVKGVTDHGSGVGTDRNGNG